MKTVYFDWGGGKLTTLLDDSDNIVYFPTCDALLDSLREPHRIISEATFESFNVQNRERVIQRATDAGHLWFTTPNRLTARTRRAMGHEDKTDEIDVTVIRHLALTNPACLKRPNVRDATDLLVTALREANRELMVLRRSNRMVENRSRLGFKMVSAKDDYAREVASHLPLYAAQPEKRRLALGNGKEYAPVIVAAAAMAVKRSSNRREFEHFAGLFAHGYPSQIRSDFHHWRFRFAARHGVTVSEFRRECRWLYHQLAAVKSQL